jgi:hypothetical protein
MCARACMCVLFCVVCCKNTLVLRLHSSQTPAHLQHQCPAFKGLSGLELGSIQPQHRGKHSNPLSVVSGAPLLKQWPRVGTAPRVSAPRAAKPPKALRLVNGATLELLQGHVAPFGGCWRRVCANGSNCCRHGLQQSVCLGRHMPTARTSHGVVVGARRVGTHAAPLGPHFPHMQ